MSAPEQQARCTVCQSPIGWVDCPTGGWWAHEQHPADGHDAVATLQDRLIVAIEADVARPRTERLGLVHAMLDTVQPELVELAALRQQLAARDAEIAQLRADLAAVAALHHPVQHAGLTICDACSPRRRDGPDRYVLMPYPCPTAAALNAATTPTT